MLTDREKALIDMLKTLAEELRLYPETGVISSDIYASNAYALTEDASDEAVERRLNYHVNLMNQYKTRNG
jgi:hypothetical protein